MTGGINWWLAGFLFASGSAACLFVLVLCIKLLIPVERDATDSETARGTGGFGSTGA